MAGMVGRTKVRRWTATAERAMRGAADTSMVELLMGNDYALIVIMEELGLVRATAAPAAASASGMDVEEEGSLSVRGLGAHHARHSPAGDAVVRAAR